MTEFLATRGPALTPAQAGTAILDLAGRTGPGGGAYLLSAAGLKELQ